jgi:hypothetical protein
LVVNEKRRKTYKSFGSLENDADGRRGISILECKDAG